MISDEAWGPDNPPPTLFDEIYAILEKCDSMGDTTRQIIEVVHKQPRPKVIWRRNDMCACGRVQCFQDKFHRLPDGTLHFWDKCEVWDE